MKLQVLSDLHLEFKKDGIPSLVEGAQVVVMPGDLASVWQGHVPRMAQAWKNASHILYVPGNHEYYGDSISRGQDVLAKQCSANGITLLDTKAVTIGEYRFIGATLWTDLQLRETGQGRGSRTDTVNVENHHNVARILNDFSGAILNASGKWFTTWEAAHRHAADRAFFEVEILDAHRQGLRTVVISHHAPSPRSVHPRFAGHPANPGFASDLEDLIEQLQPDLWLHGHTHNAADYRIGKTRILANPRGYPGPETLDFNPELTVEP